MAKGARSFAVKSSNPGNRARAWGFMDRIAVILSLALVRISCPLERRADLLQLPH